MRDPEKCDHEWEVIELDEEDGGPIKGCLKCGEEFDEDVHRED